MKAERAESKWAPITLTVETREEFNYLLTVIGARTDTQDEEAGILPEAGSAIYRALDSVKY